MNAVCKCHYCDNPKPANNRRNQCNPCMEQHNSDVRSREPCLAIIAFKQVETDCPWAVVNGSKATAKGVFCKDHADMWTYMSRNTKFKKTRKLYKMFGLNAERPVLPFSTGGWGVDFNVSTLQSAPYINQQSTFKEKRQTFNVVNNIECASYNERTKFPYTWLSDDVLKQCEEQLVYRRSGGASAGLGQSESGPADTLLVPTKTTRAPRLPKSGSIRRDGKVLDGTGLPPSRLPRPSEHFFTSRSLSEHPHLKNTSSFTSVPNVAGASLRVAAPRS